MEMSSNVPASCEGIPQITHGFPSQRPINADLSYWPEQRIEQTVDLPVIWDAMTLMWCHCNDDRKLYSNIKDMKKCSCCDQFPGISLDLWQAGQQGTCWAVLEIPTGPPVQDRQLWTRTRNFLLIFLQFYAYDLRFKAWGPTTFLTEFQTLLLRSFHFTQIPDAICIKGLWQSCIDICREMTQ